MSVQERNAESRVGTGPSRITLLRDMKPEDVARVTGGKLIKRGLIPGRRIPWEIRFEGKSSLLWAGFPKKRSGVFEVTPFLNRDRHAGATVVGSAAIIRDNELILVNPGPDDSVTGEVLSKSTGFSSFSVPISEANPDLLEARELARKNLPWKK